MTFDPAWANAISSIESGGRYGILGPVTRNGDRAYGKYQIMGNNIGPWTKEVLGQSLTPQQFVSSPEAQDAVFRAKFGQYAQKFGPEGAAKAWFAGEKGMHNPNAKDALGTSVANYAAKFTGALGQPTQMARQPVPTQMAQAPQSQPMQAQPNALQPMSLESLIPMMLAQQEQQRPVPQPGGILNAHPPGPKQNLSTLAALLQDAPPAVRGLLLQG